NANRPNVLGLKRLFLADEQPLIPWYWTAFANRTNMHGGFSANPPGRVAQ
ncbi:hypothetical protein V1272_000001, partial [Bradyrhizobium sp. AZCC 1708]